MPGPPPNPNARHRTGQGSPPGRKGSGVVRLPAEGRKGKPPPWPLLAPARSQEVSAAERALWLMLWSSPQAVAWERLGVEREVAMYCRWSVIAESGDNRAASEARLQADRLGLTPMSLRRLMWEITADEVAEQRGRAGTSSGATAKRRRPDIRAVDTAEG